MEKKKVYLIFSRSPTIGRSAFPWVSGSSIIARFLNGNSADNYVSALQNEIDKKTLEWTVYLDDTESDIEKLISQNAKLLICIPGLRFQFNRTGFDKNNVIYLSTMEYANNVTIPVLKRIDEIDNAQ
ncbi:MAG: nitrogen fixation protein NifS [Providencia heimbachae]|nr:nitrogen fixation protein NifS [Providencia heimbachae]